MRDDLVAVSDGLPRDGHRRRRGRRRRPPSAHRWGAVALVVALIAGCGHDEPGPPPAKKPAQAKEAKKPAAAPKRGPKDKVETLQVYIKIEDVVPEAERPTIRHQFRDRDFAPDPTGSENRDPFRSFVINQP